MARNKSKAELEYELYELKQRFYAANQNAMEYERAYTRTMECYQEAMGELQLFRTMCVIYDKDSTSKYRPDYTGPAEFADVECLERAVRGRTVDAAIEFIGKDNPRLIGYLEKSLGLDLKVMFKLASDRVNANWPHPLRKSQREMDPNYVEPTIEMTSAEKMAEAIRVASS